MRYCLSILAMLSLVMISEMAYAYFYVTPIDYEWLAGLLLFRN